MIGHVDKDQNVSFAKRLQDGLLSLLQLQTIFEPVDLHVVALHLHAEHGILTLQDLQLPGKFTNNSTCKIILFTLICVCTSIFSLNFDGVP